MLPLEQLAQSTLSGGTTLELSRRGDDYFLHANRRLIQSSATRRFEASLAHTCAEACRRRKSPRILLGNLGLGHTLQALIRELPLSSRITVAEDTKPLLEWHHQKLFADDMTQALNDERVSVIKGTLRKFLHKKHDPAFDLILLNLDEEAQPGTRADRRDPDFVASAISCLREFGTLLYTSPTPEKEFALTLSKLHPMQTEGYTIFLNPEKKKGPRLNILLARPDILPY